MQRDHRRETPGFSRGEDVIDLPPHRHGGTPESNGPVVPFLTLRRFAIAAVVLVVGGLLAGVLFGRADPSTAARVVVSEFTIEEDGPAEAPGPDPVTPVTGPQRGTPVCGELEDPLSPGRQVEILAAGVVLVQHHTDLDPSGLEVLQRLATRDRVAVAPNPDLDADVAVVATSWRHRMPLERIDADLLDAFVTGHAGRAPAVAACP